jgi:trk system potassium uptake protein TrkH
MSSSISHRLFPSALGLALAGALFRDSAGRAAMDWSITAAMQLPALLLWLHGRCRGWSREPSVNSSRLTAALTILALAGCGGQALGRASPDVFFTGMTALLTGFALVEAGGRLYTAMNDRLDRPLALAALLARVWFAAGLVLTVLLAIPLATPSSVPDYRHNFWLHVVTCGQAAASALSLIGVTPYSLSEDFTAFGRTLIVAATHLAGLGFAAMGLSILRPVLSRRMSLRGLLGAWTVMHALGVVALYYAFRAGKAGAAAHAWQALVYGTAAAANSGLTLGPEGLSRDLANPVIYLTITLLCLAGSLGLPLLAELAGIGSRKADHAATDRIGPLAKTAIWETAATFLLLSVAACLLFVFETPRFLGETWLPSRPVELGSRLAPLREEMEHDQRWRMAVYVSVTLRSAGLQSLNVSEGAISWPTYGLLLLWMFLGGSAGGVAGGLRCTAGVLACVVVLHGRRAWEVASELEAVRRITFRRVVWFAAGWAACNALGVGAMSLLSGAPRYDRVFESVAVMNGVGLSTGLSLHLTGWARLGMIVMMLIGRWGPVLFWAWWSNGVSSALAKDD